MSVGSHVCGGHSASDPNIKCYALLGYRGPQHDPITRAHWVRMRNEALRDGDARRAASYIGHLGREEYLAHPKNSYPHDCINRALRRAVWGAEPRGPREGPVIPTPTLDDVAELMGWPVRARYKDDPNRRSDQTIDGIEVEWVDTHPPDIMKADREFLLVDQVSNPNALLSSLDPETAARFQYALEKNAAGELVREPKLVQARQARGERDLDTLEGLGVCFLDAIRPGLAHTANSMSLVHQQKAVLLPDGLLGVQQWEGHFTIVSTRDADYGSIQRLILAAAKEASRVGELRRA